MSKKQKRRQTSVRPYVGIIIIFLVIVMGVQIHTLYRKNAELQAQEAAYKEQLEEQQMRAEELQTEEERIQDDKYVENQARGKLGLVHENEIVFRESDD